MKFLPFYYANFFLQTFITSNICLTNFYLCTDEQSYKLIWLVCKLENWLEKLIHP